MRLKFALVLTVSMLALAGCNAADTLEVVNVSNKVNQPLPDKIVNKMKAMGMSPTSPIMIRIFKEEGALEVWKANAQNRYQMIADYQICAWSGKLGPKRKEGDRQAPEGFYNIYPSQMNPQSNYYLSFNIGFPNKYDRAHGSTGTNLMVHGACSSAGCYSMTDAQVLQIYAFARDAFKGGQEYFQVQALPFRMTPENMARHRFSENYEFWKMIKVGYDHFELTHRPPVVDVCDRKYVFNQVAPDGARFSPGASCPATQTPPALTMAYSSYEKSYQRTFEMAARRFRESSYVEPSEAERKALAASGKKAKRGLLQPRRQSQTQYVLVDPNAKPAPQSTAIVGLAAEQAAAIGTIAKPPEAEAKAEPKATAAVAPIPATNPERSEPATESAENLKKKPFWKIW